MVVKQYNFENDEYKVSFHNIFESEHHVGGPEEER